MTDTRTLGQVYLDACNSDTGFLEEFEKYLEDQKLREYRRGFNAGAVSVLESATAVEGSVTTAATKTQGF